MKCKAARTLFPSVTGVGSILLRCTLTAGHKGDDHLAYDEGELIIFNRDVITRTGFKSMIVSLHR